VSGIDASPLWRRPQVVALAATWTATLVLLAAWTLWTPVWVLRQQLVFLQAWSLSVTVVLALGSSILVLRDIAGLVDRRDLLVMALPVLAGLGLTLGVAPRTNRIFYDEQIYQSVGQNLADLGRAQICNDGAIVSGRLRCSSAEYNKQPYAYPHLLSLAYRVFGAGDTSAFVVNAAAMALSIGGVYLLVALLFSDRIAAFFAALLLALTPQQIAWSASAAVEPSASAACIAALVAAAAFVRLRTTLSLMTAVVVAAYAIQFRPESLLIVPVIALLIWQRAPDEIARPRLWWAGVIFLGLAAIHLAHTAAVRNEGWGTTQARLSVNYMVDNLRANGWFYLADARFPAAYTALALVGLSSRRPEAGRLVMASYFALFFGIALLFYAGSYDYGADVRYSLATYPPLAILGGLGLARLAAALERPRLSAIPVAALTLALACQFLWYLPVVRSSSDGAWAARADVEFARTLVRDLPPNAYVLTQNPGMFQLWGVSAGQTSMAVNDPPRLDELERRYKGGLYLHWNFWCNVQDPVQRGFCARILELRTGRPVREQWTRDQRYALYRLDP
jgi:4-amino-4-deoxy-L-arabinose transferase-like glycosyltransferase